MDTIKIAVGELTEGDKLIVDSNAFEIIELGHYDHAAKTHVVKYEDEDGDVKEITLTDKAEIEEITCSHVSGRSWEHPGDPCEERVVGNSEFCGYHLDLE